MPQIYDVAIIGCGPVGATLANLLETHGLQVLVLDQFVERYPLPRATHIDGEAVRVLQSADVMDEMADKLGIYSRMRFEDAEGKLLIDWPRSTAPGSHGWRDSNRFHQPDLEAALRKRAANRPAIDLRLGWCVDSITQDDESVTLETTGPQNQPTTFKARFVVGCDGARSKTREVLGSDLQTLAPSEQWLVADLVLHPDAPNLPEGTVQYCDPERPVTYIEAVERRRRWEVMLLPGDDPETFAEPAHVYSLLDRWLKPEDADVERSVVYMFNSRLATRWRNGRVLIAGDAAHQTPPFLGQGLCAGLRDAANLSWKLAWVLDGRAKPSLLDTYQTELAPHVSQYIAEANRIGAIIQETDPERARARDANLLAQPQILAPLRPRLGGAVSPTGDELAGTLSPQPRLTDGRLLDDVVGPRFAILARSRVISEVGPETRSRWAKADARLIEDEALDYLDSIRAEAVVIRPDHYVFGMARSATELEALIAALPLADD